MSEHAYDKAWKRYRRLRLHVWIAFAGFGLSGFGIVLLKLPSLAHWTIFVPFGFWLYYFVAIIPYKKFPCPRCGKEFERRWPSKKYPDRNACPHCGLKKFGDGG